MKKHKESHFDHGLSTAQVEYVMTRFADRAAFFIETIELPKALGAVPCGLHGPIVGGAPVSEADVTYAKRGTRAWDSRLVERPAQQVRTVTVIAGPHEETCWHCNGEGQIGSWKAAIPCGTCKSGKVTHACIVYTMYGGPLAPQEPGDVRRQLEAVEEQRRERHTRGEADPGMGLSDEAERARLDPEIYGKIVTLRKKRAEADAFWSEHALSRE